MKGVKLLFVAFLCLFASGARAQYVYDEHATDTASFSWSSGNVQVSASDYSYNYIIIDKKRGLKYFIPDPSADTHWSAYVGLDGNYKTSTSPVTSVAIPSEITYTITVNYNDGRGDVRITRSRYVTVIVDEGFTTTLNGDIPDKDTTDGNGYQIYKAYDSSGNLTTYRHNRKNPYLKEVTFLPASDGKYYMQLIGQRAFQGCVHLESAMVPPSVTTMGESTFAMCFRLKNFEFATESKEVNGAKQEATSLTKVPDNCFYQCNAMQSIEVPYGVTEIGDYAFQDNWNLKQITLPNTLTKIGAHFLCRAKNLTSFYVPSSVTYIDGAFLHGCESMRDVYLLGSAAYLEYDASGSTGDASKTFEEYDETYFNPYCKAVQNCTFHVTNADHAGYIGSTLNNGTNVWLEVYGGSNGVYGKDGTPDTYDSTDDGIQHNRIIWNENSSNPQYERDFGPYKWVSVIFYNSISMSDFKTQFGNDALAATYTDCYKDSKDSKVYHLGFTTISSNGTVPAKTPLMIYIGSNTVKGYQMNPTNSETTDWKEFYTHRYNVEQSVRIGSRASTTYASGESVIMVGLPVPIPMHENEFYFKWVDAQADNNPTNPATHYGRIRRCTTAGDSYKGRFSCFWQIKKDGVRVQNAQLGSAKGFVPMDDANSPTGINNVNADKPTSFDVNIYDINGRLVGTSRASLPKGLYIQGGKKFIKK